MPPLPELEPGRSTPRSRPRTRQGRRTTRTKRAESRLSTVSALIGFAAGASKRDASARGAGRERCQHLRTPEAGRRDRHVVLQPPRATASPRHRPSPTRPEYSGGRPRAAAVFTSPPSLAARALGQAAVPPEDGGGGGGGVLVEPGSVPAGGAVPASVPAVGAGPPVRSPNRSAWSPNEVPSSLHRQPAAVGDPGGEHEADEDPNLRSRSTGPSDGVLMMLQPTKMKLEDPEPGGERADGDRHRHVARHQRSRSRRRRRRRSSPGGQVGEVVGLPGAERRVDARRLGESDPVGTR